MTPWIDRHVEPTITLRDTWAVVDLFGHRRLPGYVSLMPVGETAFLLVEVPNACTGFTADWCPDHGTCNCPRREDLSDLGNVNVKCPLHGDDNKHGEAMKFTQLFHPNAIYSITPVEEETARHMAQVMRDSTSPIQKWEVEAPQRPEPEPEPGPPPAPVGAGHDVDPDDIPF